MAWSPLVSRIALAPLVLVGPIVRRVELSSVSVWIVCKSARNCSLKVFDADNTIAAESVATHTIRLGEHIHVCLLMATPIASGTDLKVRHVYEYDIYFGADEASAPSSSVTLNSPDILDGAGTLDGINVSGIRWLTYGQHARPSFITPAESLVQTRLVHGSCRKPHGEGDDALAALDDILKVQIATGNEPGERVQQLFLTGDQIYADDVSDLLLYMLNDARTVLLGDLFYESLPKVSASEEDETLSPGLRPNVVRKENRTSEEVHFTSDEARSHLIRYGEFVSMYMFAWSPVLWPSGFPQRDMVFPSDLWILKLGLPFSGEFTEVLQDYRKHLALLGDFRKALPKVRRALANISTYMMFDDHEITDDWFLSYPWTKRCLKDNTLSRRIIQNGLAAFTVFQAWGNVPERFGAGTDERKVLDRLTLLATHNGADSDDWSELDRLLVPALGNNGPDVEALSGGLEYHFRISFKAYELIFLNTRTRRAFRVTPDDATPDHPMLIAPNRIREQLGGASNSQVTVLISPAPVMGVPLLEEVIQPLAARATLHPEYGPAKADLECWSAEKATFEALLSELLPLSQVIILSGDVHYAFSNVLHYWNERSTPAERGTFVQLCSSALLNSPGRGQRGFLGLFQRDPPRRAEYLGWETSGRVLFHQYNREPREGFETNDGSPGVLKYFRETAGTRTWVAVRPGRPVPAGMPTIPPPGLHPPAWSYRITFEKDARDAELRGYPGAIASVPVSGSAEAATLHAKRDDHQRSRVLATYTNIGLIRFLMEPGNERVRHELWYKPHPYFIPSSRVSTLPYTVHELPLAVLPESAPRPGEDE